MWVRFTSFFHLVILLLPLGGFAQELPSREQWGEKFNTAGAVLTSKEVSRTKIEGKTIVTYNLYASGLPKDGTYVLCTMRVGGDPTAIADAFINNDGEVVNVLADAARHVAEDPINVKLIGGKGEPFQFALISDDGRLRAFSRIVPFPMEMSNGPCHLSAVETGPYYSGMFVAVSGLQPGEELVIDSSSENERAQSKANATNQGVYASVLLPSVKGKRSGKAKFFVSSKSCKIGIEFPWGDGSYQPQ